MHQDRIPPLHLACSTDSLRPAMNCIQIHNGIATATSGHLLVRIYIAEKSWYKPCLESKLIHRYAWQHLFDIQATDGYFEFTTDGISLSPDEIYQVCYPYWDNLQYAETGNFGSVAFPKYADFLDWAHHCIPEIRLTVGLIETLNKILNFDWEYDPGQLQFGFQAETQAVIVFNNLSDKAYALLMPAIMGVSVTDLQPDFSQILDK